MEQSWNGNIETMSEGDQFPRPRTACPASYLEIFDTALRASGDFKGILKYAIDYTSKPGYEDSYILNYGKTVLYISKLTHILKIKSLAESEYTND